jgi:hypothetical protein
MKRETPLKSMLTPMSVPIAQAALDGQLRQIKTARSP